MGSLSSSGILFCSGEDNNEDGFFVTGDNLLTDVVVDDKLVSSNDPTDSSTGARSCDGDSIDDALILLIVVLLSSPCVSGETG
jgi:hypothetical protein